MADLFISYAREDQQIAQRLAGTLEELGWSVWWDRELVPGELFDDVIERELGEARGVIVLWSRVSVGSPWVRSEAGAAADRGVLIPVLTEPVDVPLRFRMLEAVDLSAWHGAHEDDGLRRLLAGVTALAGPPAPPGPRLPPPDRTTAEVPVVAPTAVSGLPPAEPAHQANRVSRPRRPHPRCPSRRWSRPAVRHPRRGAAGGCCQRSSSAWRVCWSPRASRSPPSTGAATRR